MPYPTAIFLAALTALSFCAGSAMAAAAAVTIPSVAIIAPGDSGKLSLQFGLFDPLSRRPQETAKPRRLGVQHLGEQQELLPVLNPANQANTGKPQGFFTWTAEVAAKRPGDYTFYSETPARWDADENLFVVLFSKVCVHALGLEEGWDEPIGQELEIIPLSRPYGLWTGNLFSGQVLLDGEPAPYVEITIGRLEEPAGVPAPFQLQKVRADSNGVFHYAMPRGGWWGFTAWSEADRFLARDGDDKAVLLGAGFWVEARPLP